MKTLIQTFLFFFFLNSVFAQQHYHDYDPDHESIIQQLLKNKAYLKSSGLSEHQVDYYIPVVFQLIAGNNERPPVEEQDPYNLLCQLNEYFNPGGVTLYLKEPPIHIVNEALANDLTASSSQAIINLIKKDSAINFFVTSDINPTGSPGQILSFSSGSGNWLGISKEAVLDIPELIAHSLGHHFNLLNTEFGWQFQSPFNPVPWVKAPGEDSFGRPTEHMDGTNCDVGGDLVCDTPPEYFSALFISECEYKDSLMDPACVPIEPMVNNIMSSYGNCNNYEFTQGQFDLMKADLEINERGLYYQNTAPQAIGVPTRPQPTFPANVTTPIVDNQIFFDWEDADMTSGYILEISTNRFFNPIIQTISTIDSEAFIENLEPNQEHHWRVTAVSSTGCSSVSSEVSFETSDEISSTKTKIDDKSFSVFPNPVNGTNIYGEFNSKQPQQAVIEVFQSDGKMIYAQTHHFQNGINSFTIPTQNLSSGISILKIKTTNGTLIEKVILK